MTIRSAPRRGPGKPVGVRARPADQERGLPVCQGIRRIRLGVASFPPADWGRAQLIGLGFVDGAEDLVLYGDVGCGKTHMAIATGILVRERGIPVRFFAASSLVMRLRRARDDSWLDAELWAVGRPGCWSSTSWAICPSTSTEPGSPVPGRRGLLRDAQALFTTNLDSDDGTRCSATGTLAAAIIDHIVHHGGWNRWVPWRDVPQRPRPERITEKEGNRPVRW
ncbi:ATP-binding protein [Bifidobacterium dentium]|uniref:ATP-binding protein n=1 Tax=Bifidobacterium dentium TaxID=1689 RepID=UPI003D2E95B4